MTFKPVNGKATFWLAVLMFLAGIAATYFTGFAEMKSAVAVQTSRIDNVCKQVDAQDARLTRIEAKLDQLIARR